VLVYAPLSPLVGLVRTTLGKRPRSTIAGRPTITAHFVVSVYATLYKGPESVCLPSERVLCFEQGFDATEQPCHAIALWDECGYAEDFG
jgi:hypothetical protein